MLKKSFLTALLLFGIFFGAGNLIFPPALGLYSGQYFWPAMTGFVLSGVGVAVLTLIIGTLGKDGYKKEIEGKISKWFSALFLSALYLTIGPFFAIPRTATTSFEIGVKVFIPENSLQIGLFIFTILYFGCAYLLSVNPNSILKSVGKILTPMFALMIVVVMVLGIMKYHQNPVSIASPGYVQAPFLTGFIEGYNTLDALAAIAFCVVALQTLKQFGFQSKKEYLQTIWGVGILVAIGFSVFYVGLGLLGNKFPVPQEVLSNSDINKGAYLLTEITKDLFGSVGQYFLGSMVILTCFTTTVGLIVSASEFFSELYSKISYKMYARVFTLVGLVIANLGLSNVIKYSVPVLLILYPIAISIVLLVIVNKFVPMSKFGMQLTVGVVVFISIFSVIKVSGISEVLAQLPLTKQSLGWLLPDIVCMLIACVLPNRQLGEPFDFSVMVHK
ncbi:branched-chain amino acid transport system II carrier protein [Carnobacteriaceae bacterium zg-ZUI78]|nr:branched-chain amino acid transport system II carrier protein [Carnobacteriaceae bacterium zg-ZUI78]